ncbi:MAG TPA: hypothetical protein VLW51_10125 [Solirubrobacteraceae bacterium]|nr:hypothetical protein [Solirubrobacteraceae bacterium]
MKRRLVTSLAIVCALSAAAPGMAGAAASSSPQQVLTDCNDHGTLTGHYTADALRTALASMPADMREYTDCYDVIEKQLFAQLGTSSSGGSSTTGSSSGGSVLPTWLVIVIVVLALAALTFGALAIRRRRLEATAGPGSPDAGGPQAPGQHGGPEAPGRGGAADPRARPSDDPGARPDDPGGSGPA